MRLPTPPIVLAGLCAVALAFNIGWHPQAAPPKEAYPGQSHHAEPPPGFYCKVPAKDAKPTAHDCHCKRMAIATKADPDCCLAEAPEDATCTVYCWKTRCLCPTGCTHNEAR